MFAAVLGARYIAVGRHARLFGCGVQMKVSERRDAMQMVAPQGKRTVWVRHGGVLGPRPGAEAQREVAALCVALALCTDGGVRGGAREESCAYADSTCPEPGTKEVIRAHVVFAAPSRRAKCWAATPGGVGGRRRCRGP